MCGRKNSLKRSGCTGNLIDSNKDSAELRSKWYRHKALIPAASLAKDLALSELSKGNTESSLPSVIKKKNCLADFRLAASHNLSRLSHEMDSLPRKKPFGGMNPLSYFHGSSCYAFFYSFRL